MALDKNETVDTRLAELRKANGGGVYAHHFEINDHFGGRRSSRWTAPIQLPHYSSLLEAYFDAHDNIGSWWHAEVAAKAGNEVVTNWADVKRRGSTIKLTAHTIVPTGLVELVTRINTGNSGGDEVYVSTGVLYVRRA